jgi:hypothetical protein
MRYALPLLFLACSSSDPKGGPATTGCAYPHCDDFKVEASKVVRNPSVKLRREYWAVFAAEKGVAMFPRPDNSAIASSICGSGTAEGALFARNGICPPSDVSKVNAMTLEDALAVSTALHARLRFAPMFGSIEPFPFTDDLIGVCDENPTQRAGVLKAVCDRAYRRRIEPSGTDEFIGFTPQEIEALPSLLNKLYGVPS